MIYPILNHPAGIVSAILLGASLTISSVDFANAKIRLRAGALDCRADNRADVEEASTKEFECIFSMQSAQGIARYRAVANLPERTSFDGGALLKWIVLVPSHTNLKGLSARFLEGEYTNIGPNVAFGIGLRPHTLMRDGLDSTALQPSNDGAVKDFGAAAVQTLSLSFAGAP